MANRPKILRRKLLAQTAVFRIEQLKLEFSNGEQRHYERLLGGARGSVLVVPLRNDGQVLLVREYAAGSDRYELGLPKGRIEAGEDLLQAAQREIKEEVGCGARKLRLLRSLTVAPGYIQHQSHIILAQDLYPERQPGDEPEPIEVVSWPLQDLETLLFRTDFTEARSLAALYLAQRFLSTELGKTTIENPTAL